MLADLLEVRQDSIAKTQNWNYMQFRLILSPQKIRILTSQNCLHEDRQKCFMQKPNHIKKTLYFIFPQCWIFKAFLPCPESIFSCVCCALLLKIYPGNMQNPFIKLPNDFSNLIFHIWFLSLFEKQPGLWKEVMNCKCVCPWKLPLILNLAVLLWHGANSACTEWCCQQPSAGGDCAAAELCKQCGSGRKIHCKGHLWLCAGVTLEICCF